MKNKGDYFNKMKAMIDAGEIAFPLVPYQEQFVMLEGSLVIGGSDASANEIPMAPLRIGMGQFDLLTSQGWKLDLIRGVYWR